MVSIISALIILLVIFVLSFISSWLDKFGQKHKEKLIEKAIDKVFSLLNSKIALVMDQYKTGPWYLMVYTKEANHPILISNNNIRSVHPDALHRKIIIKQFNGEDMVIENVENYELCSANNMCDYDM
nr:MAG TPA: hypothetical protein [Caudoviricetes sp.]